MAFLLDLNNNNHPIEINDLLVIGSDLNCHLRIDEPAVSDRHARIEKKETGFILKDLRSQTGTWVNDSQIVESWLNDEDEIRIGERIFLFANKLNEIEIDLGLKSKNHLWSEQIKRLANVAKTDFPVLLLGASGTGKEVISQALHRNSCRHNGPFISVNCSALTETLVESELFGHVKGSFTGAINDRKGAFEAARGGTLFLDEIGDLPYGMQAKLLRALENSEIRPVGSDRTVKTNVRIIAATHQNLNEKIISSQFRSDLYFRLSVVSITPPTLKERMEDFEELLYSFAKELRVRFSFGAIQRLKQHSWPGNIRELKNTVTRARAFFPKMQIEPQHVDSILDPLIQVNSNRDYGLPAHPASGTTPLPVLKELEKQMIIKRLLANAGNQRRTASDLGMPKSTLHDRLKIYRINPRAFLPGRSKESETCPAV